MQCLGCWLPLGDASQSVELMVIIYFLNLKFLFFAGVIQPWLTSSSNKQLNEWWWRSGRRMLTLEVVPDATGLVGV